jgi:aryl-alcohol dehydrogenase-like predicted oxidoreductase
MGLPARHFGSTGWELTTVGLGTWALGGGPSRPAIMGVL